MKVVLKNLILLLAVAAPTSVRSQCTLCPGGIEVDPDTDPSGFGLYTCGTAQSFYGDATGLDCVNFQFEVAPVCCPSLVPELGRDNGCGWCPNGLTNPEARIEFPTDDDETVSCVDFMKTAATGFEQFQGVCDYVAPAAEVCCPGDSAGIGYGGCTFCTGGVEFPDKIIPAADNATCQQIQDLSGFLNQTVCEANVQPLVGECCPNSLPSSSPSTAPPPPTEPPTEGFSCDFCPLGLDTPGNIIPGTNGLTCEDTRLLASFESNETECIESIKSFEGLCCPSTTDNFKCDWCSGELGIENPDLKIPEFLERELANLLVPLSKRYQTKLCAISTSKVNLYVVPKRWVSFRAVSALDLVDWNFPIKRLMQMGQLVPTLPSSPWEYRKARNIAKYWVR